MSAKDFKSEAKFGDADKRYLPRWEVSNKVLYKDQIEPLAKECISRDINCAGASIYTNECLQPSQKVQLTIYLDNDVLVRVNGIVQWCRPTDKKFLVGVNFEATSKRAQDLILKYAFDINKHKLHNHWFQGWDGSEE